MDLSLCNQDLSLCNLDLSLCYQDWNACYVGLNKYYNAFYSNGNDARIQLNLDAPIPWIGMYIAAASAICSLAMAVDAFRGFRTKKLWLPCKYFSLNATSLTLLTVTMKLTVDLSTLMMGMHDKIASVSSLVLMSTAVGNLMTSVASMDNNEILLNLTALGILVLTIAGNVCIHNVQTRDVFEEQAVLAEEIAAIVCMLILVAILCFSSLVVPTTKRYLESKYREMHKMASNERGDGIGSVVELRATLKKYWVMAETGSPQFVMARSVLSATSGLMCLLMALTLVEAYVRLHFLYSYLVGLTSSNYKWSINWILYIQSVGVATGTIAPLFRWYIAVWFRISCQKSFRDEFKIEKYWTSRLMDWRESPLSLQVRLYKFRKFLHGAKRFLVRICMGVLVFIVLTSKMVIIISAWCGKAISLCYHSIKKLIKAPSMHPNDATCLDLRPYVLLLEGETELPQMILENICNEVDELIQKGEMKQHKNLTRLLNKSVNFNGVKEFDRDEVPSLCSQEPPNCWSLPLVTLTSIAVGLPNIAIHEVNRLLNGVSEGLAFVKLIEKTLDEAGEMESIRNAAYMAWVGVELYRKWQDKDLQHTSFRHKSYKERLQKLSSLGVKTVVAFSAKRQDIAMQNPLDWPSKVIAANSMYRISETILLANRDNKHQTDEELFERLSIMISDILAACLTNLAHVIVFKCHKNEIKGRQESVRQAAVLLGESREILQILQHHDLPSLDPEKAANIEEWRAFQH